MIITRRSRRAIAVMVVLVVGLLWIRPVDAQESPALPPPPVTVQDIVNELLPLIRQLDPLMAQLTPVINELSRSFIEQGGATAEQLGDLAVQLEPLIVAAGPVAEAIAGVLNPLMDSVDTQVSPELAALLEVLGPYINQVDLSTAFQVIGPLAPTAVQAIPTLNKIYDAIDVIGPLRDPLTCPLARAVPSQPILDIVVPFLCYDTIVQGDLPLGAPPVPEEGGDVSSEPAPQSADAASDDPGEALPPQPEIVASDDQPEAPGTAGVSGAGSEIAARPNPVGTVPVAGTPSAAEPSTDEWAATRLPALPASSDARVETLETRLRLMFLFLSGLGLLLWDFFRRREGDELGGLGAFRSARTGEPPPIL